MKNTSFALASFLAGFFLLLLPTRAHCQWEEITPYFPVNVDALIEKDGYMLTYSSKRIFRSADEGLTWELVLELPEAIYGFYDTGGAIYATGDKGYLYRTTDLGTTWEPIEVNETGDPNFAAQVFNDWLYWTSGDGDLKKKSLLDGHVDTIFTQDYFTIFTLNGSLWISGFDGVKCSDDAGQTWETVFGDTTYAISMLAVGDTLLMLDDYYNRIYRSVDNGDSWNPVMDIQFMYVYNTLYKEGDKVYAFTNENLYVSEDNGGTWTLLSNKMSGFNSLVVHNGILMAGNAAGFMRSLDNGVTWVVENTGITSGIFTFSYPVETFDNHALVYILNSGTLVSDDQGDDWHTVLLDNSNFSIIQPLGIKRVVEKDGVYYGLAKDETNPLWGIYTSTDAKQWNQLYNGNISNKLDRIFFLGDTMAFYGTDNKIYASYDFGQTVVQTGTAISNGSRMMLHEDTLFAVSVANQVAYTLDLGATWTSAPNVGLPTVASTARLYDFGGNLWLKDDVGIFKTDDHGQTWTKVSAALETLTNQTSFPGLIITIGAPGIVACGFDDFIYFSPDFGSTWGFFMEGVNFPVSPYFANATEEAFFLTFTDTIVMLRRSFSSINPPDAITGLVFDDANNNQVQDNGELGLPNTIVQLGDHLFTSTDSLGHYGFFGEFPDDTLLLVLPTPYATVFPSNYPSSTPGSGYDFAVHYQPNVNDLAVVITQNGPFRPGFDNIVRAEARNIGTTAQDATLRLVLDPLIDFVEAQPSPSSTIADTLYWDMPDFQAFERRSVDLMLHTPIPVVIGTTVQLSAHVASANMDETPENNNDTLVAVVVGSYDPNIKEVEPSELDLAQLQDGEPLVYTIHFQNTGTFPASFVTIHDTLSANLDIASFQLLSASHPVSWTMRDSGIVEFHFNDINLPDSTSNEPGSHGFVKFSIKPNPSLQLNDAVDNTAHIVFDFNAPITTNTARTLVVEVEVPVQERRPAGALLLSPNPTSGTLRISLPTETAKEMMVGTLQIFNASGKVILSQSHPCNSCSVDVSRLPSGSYFMLLKTAQGDFVGRFERI